MSNRLPTFKFNEVELHVDRPNRHQNIYKKLTRSQDSKHRNPNLGTQIWWGEDLEGHERCIKEFYAASPSLYGRDIPDPIWRNPSSEKATGAERGLEGVRADAYDLRTNVPLETGVFRTAAKDEDFLAHFNAYSFELESLVCQFAQHHQASRLVSSYRWGSVEFPGSRKKQGDVHYAIEMEKLEKLAPPRVGEYVSVVDRIIDMMAAVSELHSMAVPVRCFPPELVRDLSLARENPITRIYHYDLSPDQFMYRPAPDDEPGKVVLIDFNSSRMAHAEYENFFWYMIPGKNYYQPPERRKLQEFRAQRHEFESSPVYDLYSLLVIAFFYFMRNNDSQLRPSHIPDWKDPEQFLKILQSSNLEQYLREHIDGNRGINPMPFFKLFETLRPNDPKGRKKALQDFPHLDWGGDRDWMLVPKVMNLIARHSIKRQFRVTWKNSSLSFTEGDAETNQISVHDYLAKDMCEWAPGDAEFGRIDHPDFTPDDITFFQAEEGYPIVRKGFIEPEQAGTYTLYPSWGGCIDFDNPLTIHVQSHTGTGKAIFVSHKDRQEFSSPVEDLALANTVNAATEVISPEQIEEFQSYLQEQHPELVGTASSLPTGVEAREELMPSPQTQPHQSISPESYGYSNSVSPEDYGAYHSTPPPDSAYQNTPVPDSAYHSTPVPDSAYHSTPVPDSAYHSTPVPDSQAYQYNSTSPEEQGYQSGSVSPEAYDFQHSSVSPEAYQSISPDPYGDTASMTGASDTVAVLPVEPRQTPQGLSVPPEASTLDPVVSEDTVGYWLGQISGANHAVMGELYEEIYNTYYPDPIPAEINAQILSRHCQLKLKAGKLTPESELLKNLAKLFVENDLSKTRQGWILNNLTIGFYQSALKVGRLPPWKKVFGFDPLSHLKNWLQLTNPVMGSQISGLDQKLQEDAHRTLRIATMIRKRLRTKK